MIGLAHLPCCGQVGSPTSHSFLWSRRCTPSPQKLPTGTTASVLPHCRHRDPVLPARGKPPLVECQHGVRGNRGCSLGGLPPVGSFLGGSHRGWSSLERALMGGGVLPGQSVGPCPRRLPSQEALFSGSFPGRGSFLRAVGGGGGRWLTRSLFTASSLTAPAMSGAGLRPSRRRVSPRPSSLSLPRPRKTRQGGRSRYQNSL